MTPSHVRYRAAPRPDLESGFSQNLMGASTRSCACSPPELRAQRGEALADPPECRRVGSLAHAELELLGPLARLGEQALLRALQGQALVVEQGLDAPDEIEVAVAVEALPGRVLLGSEQLELRLPVAQHVGRDSGQGLDLSDAVIELLGGLRHGAGPQGCGRGGATGAVGPAAVGGRDPGLLIRCFSPLLGLNVSTLRAVISMLSPVWGLRPRREAFWRIRKCPKPTIFTSSPFSKQLKMMSKTDSTTDDDCRLERPCAATAFTRSFLVTVTLHPPSRALTRFPA